MKLRMGEFGKFGFTRQELFGADETPTEAGLRALRYFYDANWDVLHQFNIFGSKPEWSVFIDTIKAVPGGKFAIEAIGNGIQIADISDWDVKGAMMALAMQTKGKIPTDYQKFIMALNTEAQEIDAGFIANVALATFEDLQTLAKQGAGVAMAVGKGYVTLQIVGAITAGLVLITMIYKSIAKKS